jgi:hypothetical protein
LEHEFSNERKTAEAVTFTIENGWPYQVALAQRLTTGRRSTSCTRFCKDLSLCQRGHCFVRGSEYIKVWCFAEEADAQKFTLALVAS